MSSAIEEAIEAVLKSKFPVAAKRRVGVLRHPGRRAAKDERYVCLKAPPPCLGCGKALDHVEPFCVGHVAVILFPAGVPHSGCGRNFATKHGLEVRHVETFSDPVKYPYGCLSDILPADERKVR